MCGDEEERVCELLALLRLRSLALLLVLIAHAATGDRQVWQIETTGTTCRHNRHNMQAQHAGTTGRHNRRNRRNRQVSIDVADHTCNRPQRKEQSQGKRQGRNRREA